MSDCDAKSIFQGKEIPTALEEAQHTLSEGVWVFFNSISPIPPNPLQSSPAQMGLLWKVSSGQAQGRWAGCARVGMQLCGL